MLLAVCRELDIEFDEAVIPGIAFGFAGGIGNTGAVCGAVAGATMAIALKLGRAEDMGQALERLGVTQEFRRRFEEEMKTISCRELTGLDLTKLEAQEMLMNSDVTQTACFPAVAAAYRITLDLLSDSE